jgi:hypothetical protein
MKIELKKIKHMPSMSEETECFTADLYIDGTHRGNVSNRGFGGPTDFSERAAEEELNAYGKTLPPLTSELVPEGLEQDGELIVGELLGDYLAEQHERKLCKGKTVFRTKGTPKNAYNSVKGWDAETLAWVRAKHPEAEIINLKYFPEPKKVDPVAFSTLAIGAQFTINGRTMVKIEPNTALEKKKRWGIKAELMVYPVA